MTDIRTDARRDGTPGVPPPRTGSGLSRRPRVAFAVLFVACLSLAFGYAWRSSARRAALFGDATLPPITRLADLEQPTDQPSAAAPADPDAVPAVAVGGANAATTTSAPESTAASPAAPDVDPPVAANTPRERTFFVRHTGLDASYGVMSVLRLSATGEDRRATPLRCDRLHFAVDRGVCLATDRFYTTHSIMVFDRAFEPLFTLPLNGVPSRARVSPDGRRAAVTVFVTGHSYADEGFSTETSILDTHTGERLVRSLEEFEVRQNGARMRAADINFWGVTFTSDGDRFYATLGTGGRVYLVEGRVSERRVTVIREGVECPSLSPDQTRVAFKKRVYSGTDFAWRLHVMDLDTYTETPLAETRNVDDQVEWLDDGTILYAMPDPSAPTARVTNIWRVAADGGGDPAPLLRQAFSPAALQ
jgi:hypothetical protein